MATLMGPADDSYDRCYNWVRVSIKRQGWWPWLGSELGGDKELSYSIGAGTGDAEKGIR